MSSSSSSSLSLSLDSILSTSHNFLSTNSNSNSKPHHRHQYHHLPIKSSPQPQTQTQTSTSSTFLDPISLHRLQTLQSFQVTHQLPTCSSSLLLIRPMGPADLDSTVSLLARSFAEAMWMQQGYIKLLEFYVKQYVQERTNLIPHTVMLVGFLNTTNTTSSSIDIGEDGDEDEWELACTAEVSFDARGANANPPTPSPPPNCPYICNMTVKKEFRR